MQINYSDIEATLSRLVEPDQLADKIKTVKEILRLKEEKNAVILGHNYMEPALYNTVPDFLGDSLELARKAAETDKDIIVFCGVDFMGETAKILSPDKTVLIPAKKAGCSLAESITAQDVRDLKKRFPGVPVVTYVNTYADVKAETDVCCTSGNANAVVESLNADTIIFLPDEFLAQNVARDTGKHLIFPTATEKLATNLDYQMIGWRGRCEVHEHFTAEDIKSIRQEHADVVVLAHPECRPEVTAEADFSGSTSAMIKYVEQTDAAKYLLLTECSMAENIAAVHPEKYMLRQCRVRCPHMEEITLEGTLAALQHLQYEVTIDEKIRIKAERSVQRMIEIG